jgi:uncharacterized damage-inducible protein DinB
MRRRLFAALLPFALVVTGLASTPSRASAQGLMAELQGDVTDLQKKLVDLANAIPESSYGWRPAAGVRSIGEVFKHVAADNYLIPIMMGMPAPASSGITATNMKSVGTYENRTATKAEIIAELQASFAHLQSAMRLTTDANITSSMNFFGQTWTRQKAMVMTVTHLHEHLGQSIAYARSNNVVPPWSK